MSDQPSSRGALWELIKSVGGKQSFELWEMTRLGFWDPSLPDPKLTKQFIKRRQALQTELNELVKQHQRFEDREKLLAEIHRIRKEDARLRRQETKDRREAERLERAKKWAEKQQRDICWLGEKVSSGLETKETHAGRLLELGLPVIESVEDLAKKMDLKVGRIRFLAFHRKVSKINHYRRFYMAKKSGGKRLISAPMPQLKFVQHWLLENLLNKVRIHEAAHGFVPGRSICTNAAPHVGADIVVNMDLRNSFPTLTYPRVKGMYRSLGYSEQLAIVFALLCTEPEVDEVEMDGQRYYLHKGERHLPQGAPTSPAITNIICRRFDARMQGIADQLGLTYTRYADDVTFSGPTSAKVNLGKLLWRTQAVIQDEGFVLHPDKLRIMNKGARQEVTGIVVNEKLSLNRSTLKRFRALLFQIELDGIAGKTWNGAPKLLPAIRGYAYFIQMVDPEKGQAYVGRVNAILAREGWRQEVRHPARGYTMPDHREEVTAATADPALASFPEGKPTPAPNASKGEKRKKTKPWWKFW